MCLRFHSIDPRAALGAAFIAAVLLGGCHRGGAQGIPAEQPNQPGVIGSAITPGIGKSLVTDDPRAAQYYDNVDAVTTGARLFKQYNCNGCHSSGGGGMGPNLMDAQWIYGSRLAQIHQTLVEGRPNGMPAWGARFPITSCGSSRPMCARCRCRARLPPTRMTPPDRPRPPYRAPRTTIPAGPHRRAPPMTMG